MWFTRVSISNPVFATMMMAALLVLGAFSYSRLPVEQFPDVSFPVVVVQTDYPGASPENVEEEVTRKIEETVNTVSGIKTLSSRSYEGRSAVIVEFDLLGTHSGPFLGLEPTGKEFRCRMAAFFIFEDGTERIEVERVYFDSATIPRQLTA